jgi:4-aminobutyrate aminotransferase-like enzyme
MNAGTWGNVIRWMPPLVVDEREIARGLEAFAMAMDET